MESKSLCSGGGYISRVQNNYTFKLKFSYQTHLTHINIIIEYCLNNVDVLYLEEENVHRPVLKKKTASMFFLKKPFLGIIIALM